MLGHIQGPWGTKVPRAAPPAAHSSPGVVGWCGASTGGRCPVFSATALQDPGLQLAAPPCSLLLVRVRSCPFRSVRSRLPPGSFPACSPWLLGLWPELLWLSLASFRVAGRFVRGRPLHLACTSVWACMVMLKGYRPSLAVCWCQARLLKKIKRII